MMRINCDEDQVRKLEAMKIRLEEEVIRLEGDHRVL